MKRINLLLLVVTTFLLLNSCAPNELIEECLIGKTYGFWNGLWHGIICPITFIVSLFKDEVVIYAINNDGGWYDFGFLIGVKSLVAVIHKRP